MGIEKSSSPIASREALRFLGRAFAAALIACVLIAARPVGAQAASDLPQIRQSCEELQTQRGQIPHISRWRMLGQLLRLKFRPGSVAFPDFVNLNTPERELLPTPSGNPPAGRNLIFSLMPPARLTQGPEFERAKARYEELTDTLLAMLPQLRSFMYADGVDECIALAKEAQFDFKAFQTLGTERAGLEWVNQIRDGREASAILSRTKLRHDWEVYHTTDLMTVFQSLRSTQVRNIIIVAHADTDGRIFDSSFNEYPIGFFSDISPTIESISIYSCHSEKVVERYKIAERIRVLPTYHERRTVYRSVGMKLMGIQDVVPIKSLGSFIKKVDHWQSFEEDEAKVKPAHAYCRIGLEGVQAKSGGFGFLLNGEFIGAINPGTHAEPLTLYYPCSLADRAKNVLVLKGIHPSTRSALTAPPELLKGWITRAVPAGPGGAHQEVRSELPPATHYRRPDGSYQSSKWVF
jgi:hypothetical protein